MSCTKMRIPSNWHTFAVHHVKRNVLLSLVCICVACYIEAKCGPVELEGPQPLGKLYEVGGHKMHLYLTGEGNRGPAVVLEAGAGAFSIDWYLVQQEVMQFTRVCSYDRAGHAWSELGPRPRTYRQAAYDLHRLLAKAGIPAPYVMVGHSMGGALVRTFVSEYPDDVVGIVLVDVGIEGSPGYVNGKVTAPWEGVQPRPIPTPRDIHEDERVLAKPELDGYKQFRELFGPPKIEPPFDRLPEPIQRLRLWAMSLPQSNVTDYNAYAAEEGFLLFADRIRHEHPLGNKPVVILSRKSDEQERMKRQRELLNLSGNSVFSVSDFPVHEIHLAQPDLVVEAIRTVLESIQTGGKLRLPNSAR